MSVIDLSSTPLSGGQARRRWRVGLPDGESRGRRVRKPCGLFESLAAKVRRERPLARSGRPGVTGEADSAAENDAMAALRFLDREPRVNHLHRWLWRRA